jgi:hypothetical protein
VRKELLASTIWTGLSGFSVARGLPRLRRVDDGIVQNVANRHHPGAQINPEDAALALVAGGDEGIFARRLRTRAFARRVIAKQLHA